MYKLIASVRGGITNSALLSQRFATVEDARTGAKQLMHENNRVVRIMIVADNGERKFVEWIERS